MNTQTTNQKEALNIKTFLQFASGRREGDYTMEAAKFIYDLDTIKGTKIWRDRLAADNMISKLKKFYLIDETATFDELQNHIQTMFDEHKIAVPNYYQQTELNKRFIKVMDRIFSQI